MPKPLLIVISGLPCTGKTTLGKRIAKEFNLPLISRDDIKQSLFDSLGIKDREWSRKIGAASYDLIYKLSETLLGSEQSFILESNFKPEYDIVRFVDLKQKFDFKIFQIVCTCDDKILLERFKKRSESGERHPGHVDDQNYDEFKDVFTYGKQKALDIGGEIIEVDTGNFDKIDYNSIYSAVESALKSKIS